MAPRNRPSPSTSPGTTGLTKKQRQALRIQRPAASPDVASSSDVASSDVDSAVPSAGTSPASMPVEGIRIQRYVAAAEERERASPSKYPTPLPDEEEDELPVLPPVDVEAAAEEVAVFEVDVEDMEEKTADVAVPVGSLIDVFDEEDDAPAPAALSPVLERSEPDVAQTAGVSHGAQAALRPKELSLSPPTPPQSHPPSQPAEIQADPSPPPPKAPRTRTPPPPQPSPTPFQPQGVGGPSPAATSSHVRTPPRAPTAGGHVRQISGQGQGHGHGQAAPSPAQPAGYGHHAHLRAPEAPRPAPPRALALGALSLSHTLRSALAASTQAVTSTATAYAHAYANSSAGYSTAAAAASYPSAGGRRVSGGGNGDAGGVRQGDRDAEGDGETILGARWDEVEVEVDAEADGPRPTTRRLLTLTYAGGVQVWDASSLGGVEEVLNLRIPLPLPSTSSQTATSTLGRAAGTGIERTNSLRGVERSRSSVDTLRAVDVGNIDKQRKGAKQDEGQEAGEEMFGPILSAAILPSRSRVGKDGPGEGLELGILTPRALYIYALGTGCVHARRAFSPAPAASANRDDGDKEVGTPHAFEAGERAVVVTTHSPSALVILARPSLRVLHVFPAVALAVPHPLTSAADNAGNRLSTSFPSSTSPHASPSPTSPTAEPAPISALHGRLLAFLAPPPTPTSPSVLSNPSTSPGTGEGAGWGRTLGRFFSRSAPAAAGALAATVLAGAGSPPSLAGMASAAAGGAGAWVRVVDLGPLLGGSQAERGGGRDRGKGGAGGVRDVHVFDAGRAPLGGLAFSCDGVRLFAVRRDGLGASVWALRPSPSPLPSPLDTLPVPAHVYALRRGRTGAVVEAVAGARDGRFVALATRRRTVHVFAVNPYGGRADVRSHLRARVRDADAGVGASTGGEGGERPTEVHALVRMRLPPPPQAQEGGEASPPPAPLAIAFVPASSAGGGPGGLRSPTSPASPASAGSSGVQDVLVFDPADGVLSLRRVTLALGAPHSAAGLPISVSLPTGRLSMSASPPASYVRGAAAVAEAPGELGGKEAVVATWSLRRKRGWAEIRRVEGGEGKGKGMGGAGRRVKEDWLAQAELSTFTSAPRVLPRAIYLSHQFAFYTLGEDYHALIRRYQFAIGGAKIDVRREVEVSSAYISFAGEAFVEGYVPSSSSSPRAIRRQSHGRAASFDEPLASALAGAHYRDARPPPVLPMLPNGSPASFRSAMPVRAVVAGLGDGVAEGLGRLRREMRHQAQRQRQLARSPQTGGGDDIDAFVPLEFDEEDEDFAGPIPGVADEVFLRVHADREDDDALSAGTSHSRGGEESVASVSTPATSAHPLEDERVEQLDLRIDTNATEGEWQGWAAEDTQALEEAERFDDISVVGFLDEEQAAMKAEAARRKGTAARTRTKKRRN